MCDLMSPWWLKGNALIFSHIWVSIDRLFLKAQSLVLTSLKIYALPVLVVTMFFPLTIVTTGSPGPHGTVQSSIQPQQQPADTEPQQQPKHEVHLLFGHTVTHKVILRRVHQRMVSVIWNHVVNMMPVKEKRKDLQNTKNLYIKYKIMLI